MREALFALLALLACTRSFLPAGTQAASHFSRRPAVLRLSVTSIAEVEALALPAVTEKATTLPEPPAEKSPPPPPQPSPSSLLNKQIMAARDTGTVLQLTKAGEPLMKPANVASALHRLAVLNKRERASRDALLRDPRFERLVVMLAGRAEALSSRSVSDVLWSFATLQHWPPMLLKPLLTSVATHLTKDDIEAPYLSTMVWALAKLECKPVRLLEQMEEIALPLLSQMNTQNLANLFWGFAKLNYQPTRILPKIEEALLAPGMLETAKPVEVADLAYALGVVGAPHAHDRLLLGLADRAAPDPVFGSLHTFSSRQIVILIWVVARLDAVAQLPEGRMEAWVSAVRAAHEATPLLVTDARNLERSLESLGLDASWVQRSEMLNTWTDLADGRSRRRAGRAYSDDELRTVFEAIDSDGSGDIDQAELLEAIRAIRPDATDEDVDRMLAVANGNGNDTIDLAEFKLMMSTP